MYLETQDKLKARKLDDLEQYSRRESLRFNGFQTKQNESSEDCAKMVKQYIRNTLKVEDDFNRIHRIGQSINAMMEGNVNRLLLSLKVLSPERKYIEPESINLTFPSN